MIPEEYFCSLNNHLPWLLLQTLQKYMQSYASPCWISAGHTLFSLKVKDAKLDSKCNPKVLLGWHKTLAQAQCCWKCAIRLTCYKLGPWTIICFKMVDCLGLGGVDYTWYIPSISDYAWLNALKLMKTWHRSHKCSFYPFYVMNNTLSMLFGQLPPNPILDCL